MADGRPSSSKKRRLDSGALPNNGDSLFGVSCPVSETRGRTSEGADERSTPLRFTDDDVWMIDSVGDAHTEFGEISWTTQTSWRDGL